MFPLIYLEAFEFDWAFSITFENNGTQNGLNTIKKLLTLLTQSERKRAVLLLGMVLVMAFLDVLGVASILPFMAVLTNPDLVQSNVMLNTLFIISRHIGIQTSEQFLLALGVLVFVLLIASLAFKALTTYAQTRFVMMREYSVSKRLVESYLRQPYSWFLSRHSADLGKNILSEVETCIDSGLQPMLNLLVHSIVALAMLILLLVVDPLLALSMVWRWDWPMRNLRRHERLAAKPWASTY